MASKAGSVALLNPDSAQQIFDHAQSVFWVGYIAWQRGDAEEAKKQFTDYYDLAQQLVAIDPDKDEWQMEIDYASSNLGTLEMDQGEAAKAEGYFRKSLEVSKHLLEKHPDNVDRVLAAGQSDAWLADAMLRQANIAQARSARRGEIALYEAALRSHSENGPIKKQFAVALYSTAQLEIAAGHPELAALLATDATRLAVEALAVDPENTRLVDRASFAHTILGEAHLQLGQMQEARTSLRCRLRPVFPARAGV